MNDPAVEIEKTLREIKQLQQLLFHYKFGVDETNSRLRERKAYLDNLRNAKTSGKVSQAGL